MSHQQLKQLIHDLQDGNDQKRRSASYKLGRSGLPSLVPFLIKAYDDPDSTVKQNVLTGLVNLGTEAAIEFVRSVRMNITEAEIELAKRELAAGRNKNNVAKGLINRGLTQNDVNLAFDMARSAMVGSYESRRQLANMYRKRMTRGLLIAVAGAVITAVTYSSATSSPGGGVPIISRSRNG
jgi:hypothetical protein